MTKDKAVRIFKKIGIIFSILFIVILLSMNVAYVSNKHVRTYMHFPSEVKSQSIGLGLSLVRNYVIPYSIDEEKVNEVNKEQLEEAVDLGAIWLIRMQESQGRFNYWYNPDTDKLSARHDDNFLRQAGTCYSMCVSSEATGDTAYLIAAQKSLNYLLNYKKNFEEDKSYFQFGSKAKLGGIALPMLAMLKMRELTDTTIYDEELKKLANMIFYLQDADGTGQFKSTYFYLGKFDYDWHSQIYPGEALYALSEMYQAFGDEIYKERFDYAAKFYDDSKYWGKSAFMPWTISALSNMYLLTSDTYYLDYAKKISDRMLLTQNMNPNSEAYGSWNPVPMVNSSTCMEALGDLLEAIHVEGNAEDIEYYQNRAIIGYRWLMQLQLGEDDLEGIIRPHLALGGFPASNFDHNIRIDNTQHSITALSKGIINIYSKSQKTQ